MTDSALFRDAVRAFATGDVDTARRLDGQIDQDSREDYNIFVTAVFFGAVSYRFGDRPEQHEVREFVDQMRREYAQAEPAVKPLVIEGLIRAAFGEEHFLDEISPEEQLTFQFPVIHKIVSDSDEMRARLDDYLADAETLAREWTTPE